MAPDILSALYGVSLFLVIFSFSESGNIKRYPIFCLMCAATLLWSLLYDPHSRPWMQNYIAFMTISNGILRVLAVGEVIVRSSRGDWKDCASLLLMVGFSLAWIFYALHPSSICCSWEWWRDFRRVLQPAVAIALLGPAFVLQVRRAWPGKFDKAHGLLLLGMLGSQSALAILVFAVNGLTGSSWLYADWAGQLLGIACCTGWVFACDLVDEPEDLRGRFLQTV